jgi:murein DD-endopeptidase MepM/ murein hydrolase activator NlpD
MKPLLRCHWWIKSTWYRVIKWVMWRKIAVAAFVYVFILLFVQFSLPGSKVILPHLRFLLYDYQISFDWEKLDRFGPLQAPATWIPVKDPISPGEDVIPAGSAMDKEKIIYPVEGEITSTFGWRRHPVLGQQRFHYGIDISAPEGTSIRAAQGGLVAKVDEHPDLGLVIYLDHGGGLETIYAHCKESLVELNQAVKQEEVIATVGATGLASSPHLHFEIKEQGVNVDPALYLKEVSH